MRRRNTLSHIVPTAPTLTITRKTYASPQMHEHKLEAAHEKCAPRFGTELANVLYEKASPKISGLTRPHQYPRHCEAQPQPSATHAGLVVPNLMRLYYHPAHAVGAS